ncbi:restriction endonuclease subunit S [uncultured Methanobrevibacter sp.]|uniref:restriction endonuclease subunit S n=1 Tax=uncultured Methanobrevibacter sp. TaxID=253161 RepID=UPI003184473B
MQHQILRFSGFDDEWKSVKLGDILTFYSTNSFSREKLNYEQGNVKNIHYGDIHTKFPTILSVHDNKDIPFINNDIDLSKYKDSQYLQDGDLIIADASEDYADIGKAIEVKDINDEKVLAGLHTILARDEKNITINGFKGYLFLTDDLKTNIKRIANGISVLGISKNNLSKLSVNIPSKSEQQNIVNLFSFIDKKIELLEHKYEDYQNFKKYLMQQIFAQKLIDATDFRTEIKI